MKQLTQNGPSPGAVTTALAPEVFRIRGTRSETSDVFSFDLVAPDGRPFRFLPGQFNMLYTFGAGESAISISGPPDRPDLLTHTIREVGPVTKALGRLRPGDAVGVRGPYGTPWPIAEQNGGDVVILAGGLGIAPLRPVIYHVLSNREAYGNVSIIYGSRTPDDIVFSRELAEWRGRYDLQVAVTVDRAPRTWRGHVGVVTTLVERNVPSPETATAYLCGPEIMMRFAADELLHRGISAEKIYLSLERNMHCAVGLCGHCQLGSDFICRDGPVFSHDRIRTRMEVREL